MDTHPAIKALQGLKRPTTGEVPVSGGIVRFDMYFDNIVWNQAVEASIDTIRSMIVGEKPAVFYCESGKSLEGLEQGALAVLSNLMMKTNATSAEFMIGNEKDGEFYFTCSRTKPTAALATSVEKG